MRPVALAYRKAPAIFLLLSVDCTFIIRTANIFRAEEEREVTYEPRDSICHREANEYSYRDVPFKELLFIVL